MAAQPQRFRRSERVSIASLSALTALTWLAVAVSSRDPVLIVGVTFISLGFLGGAHTGLLWATGRITHRLATALGAIFLVFMAMGGLRFAPVWLALPATILLLAAMIVAVAVMHREARATSS
jgi:hypothetical protein